MTNIILLLDYRAGKRFSHCFQQLIIFLVVILGVGICPLLADVDPAKNDTCFGIVPCARAHYSFGVAVDSSGQVLFTEFSHRQINRWDPQANRFVVLSNKDTPGMFGLTAGLNGDLFVGLDLGDAGNPGKILRVDTNGQEELIVRDITRPRQLACDRSGNLFAVLEAGRVLKWDRANRTISEVMMSVAPVSGIAVGDDGSVYVSEYGVFDTAPEGYSRPSTPGRVIVRRPNGDVTILAEGFWRARGLALHNRDLYLCSESNREDHGNAGALVRIDAMTGVQSIVLDRLDYPQFPAVSADGTVYFTLARDNWLVAYDPATPFQKIDAPAGRDFAYVVKNGSLAWEAEAEGIPFTITAQSVAIKGKLCPKPEAKQMDGWFQISADQFQLNPNDLYLIHDAEHPAPGLFELPTAECRCDFGKLHVNVFPLRRHQGKRWPMQHVGTSKESPSPDFSEQPEAYRFHFSWTVPSEPPNLP